MCSSDLALLHMTSRPLEIHLIQSHTRTDTHLAIDGMTVADLVDDDTIDFDGITCLSTIDGKRCFASRVTGGSTTLNYTVNNIRYPYLRDHGYDVYGVSTAFDIDGCLVFITTYGVTVSDDDILQDIDVKPKTKGFRGYEKVGGRWSQKVGSDHILIIDKKNVLKRITWTDIRNNTHSIDDVKSGVEDFIHDDGLATLGIDGHLTLPCGKTVNLNKTSNTIKWSIVIRTSKLWIVGGDSGHPAMLITVNNKGKVLSAVKFKLSHASTIQYLKTIYDRRGKSMVMAVERYFAIHLISISCKGYFRVQVKKSFLAQCNQLDNLGQSVISVISLDNEGELFIVGTDWLKQINVCIS